MAAPSQPSLVQMMQQNALTRQAILANAIKMKQQIYSATVDPASQNVINVTGNTIRNVGLLLGYVIEVTGDIKDTDAANDATRTPWGNANMLTQIMYNDLSNVTRIQVPGWHLALLNTVRQGFGYGGVYANNLPMGYGSNFDVYSGLSTLTHGVAQTLRMQYYVPIAYSSTDLRGSIFMGTVSATSNLQITINQTPLIAATDNPINGVYQMNTGAASGGWNSNVTVTVYQIYLDQIPMQAPGVPLLPQMDINTIYELKQTSWNNPTSGQDYPMYYTNARSFLSTIAIFDNGGVYNTGSDVNYFSLVSANSTNIWKVTPEQLALDARMRIMTDMPDGTYLIESRDIPINTINYGNMALNINANGVLGTGARVLVGYEAFAQVNALPTATSLGGG